MTDDPVKSQFFVLIRKFRIDSKEDAGETPALPGLFTGLS